MQPFIVDGVLAPTLNQVKPTSQIQKMAPYLWKGFGFYFPSNGKTSKGIHGELYRNSLIPTWWTVLKFCSGQGWSWSHCTCAHIVCSSWWPSLWAGPRNIWSVCWYSLQKYGLPCHFMAECLGYLKELLFWFEHLDKAADCIKAWEIQVNLMDLDRDSSYPLIARQCDLLGGIDVIDQEDHSYYMGDVNNGCGLGEHWALR